MCWEQNVSENKMIVFVSHLLFINNISLREFLDETAAILNLLLISVKERVGAHETSDYIIYISISVDLNLIA